MKRLHRNRKLLPLLLLILAGCFRQAGQDFDSGNPVDSAVPLATNTIVEVPPQTILASPTNPPAITILPPQDTQPPPPTINGTSQSAIQPVPTIGNPTVATTPLVRTPGGPQVPFVPDPATPTPIVPFASVINTPSGLITPTALAGVSDDGCSYVVQSGDNLFRIALNNNISLEQLRAGNPGISEILQIGQVLSIPGCGQGFEPITGDIIADPLQPTPIQSSGTGQTIYTVVSGDTLFTIAQEFGVTVQDIVTANNLANPNALAAGQQLIIPPVANTQP